VPARRPSGISRRLTGLRTLARRPAALAAVALLHVALVLALLTYSNERIVHVQPVAREITLRLQALPKPLPRGRIGHRVKNAPGPALPNYRGITIPDAPIIPDAPVSPALRQALFGCTDGERSDLSPTQRARCANAFAHDDSVDIRDGTTRSRAAALWERGRQRKNAPFLAPCMNPQGFSPLYTALCAAQAAVDGKYDPDAQPGYFDQPDIVHVPNGGDPPSGPPSSH